MGICKYIRCALVIWIIIMLQLKIYGQAPDSLQVIHHFSYDILYNNHYHCPSVVVWPLSWKYLGDYSRRPHIRFSEDPEAPAPRVSHQDYNNSGYDRGHLCPSGDRGCCLDYWEDTFVMTNIAPMRPRLNRGAWKAAEDECREMAKTGCDLTVTSISLWLSPDTQFVGSSKVRVPSHFYKKADCHIHSGHTIHWLMKNTQDAQKMPLCVISEDSARHLLQNVNTTVYEVYK